MNAFRKYLVEFIGTFFLILTIGSTSTLNSSGVIPPLAIGGILMVMIYAGGPISGGHYNPAVTLAVLLRGAMPKRDAIPYMIAQVLGGVVGALAVLEFKHRLDPVPGGLGPVGGDGDLLADQMVHQRGLSHVGAADQGRKPGFFLLFHSILH